MLWDVDIEGEAEGILSAEGFALDEPPDLEILARCIVGCSRVVDARGLRVPAQYLHEIRTIQLRPGMSPRRRRYLLAHELAERHLVLHCYERDDVERLADSIAAAIVLPRRAMRAAVGEVGRHLLELSDLLGASQSVVALRLGEVTGSPLALVTPRRVHVRGEPWEWPSEAELRQLARGPLPEGMERDEVSDAPRRWVLTAA
jgi:hypothetical protein